MFDRIAESIASTINGRVFTFVSQPSFFCTFRPISSNTSISYSSDCYVHFLDVNSGQLAGRLRADKSPIVGTPVVVGDVVVVQTDDDHLVGFRIETGSG